MAPLPPSGAARPRDPRVAEEGARVATTVEAGTRPPRPEKVAVVDEVRERLSASNATILTEYRGLPVSNMAELRRLLAAVGGEYRVYKNTLVRRAARESGLDSIEPLLEGPTAIAFVSGDVAAVAKVLRDFARTHPSLVVKGGLVGSSLLDAKTTSALAELPSREVLLAQIAGGLAAPMQKFAALLLAVPQKFAYALSALLEARGGAPVDAPSAVEASGAMPGEAEVVETPAAEREAVDAPASAAEAEADASGPAEADAPASADAAADAPASADAAADAPASAADTADPADPADAPEA